MTLQSILLATVDGETQRIEEVFFGKCRRQGTSLFLTYEEPENKGRTFVKLSPEYLLINRCGELSTQLRFSPLVRESSYYMTPAGRLSLTTETSNYLFEENADSGQAIVEYTLYINEQLVSHNCLTLKWIL